MNIVLANYGMPKTEFKGLYGPDNRPLPSIAAEKPKPVKRVYVVRFFSYEAENRLLRLLDSLKGDHPARDLMIMELGFGTGLRIAEVGRLTVGHVRNQEDLTVVCKGSKERVLPISKHLQRRIKDFIKRKLIWGESIRDDAPLFVSQMDGPLSRRSMQEMFEKWCKRAGLTAANGKAAYTFHCMRHTFAMRLRERGYTIEKVAEMLGHSSIESTRKYFRMTMEEMREAVNSL